MVNLSEFSCDKKTLNLHRPKHYPKNYTCVKSIGHSILQQHNIKFYCSKTRWIFYEIHGKDISGIRVPLYPEAATPGILKPKLHLLTLK